MGVNDTMADQTYTTLEGGHETVAKTAQTLHESGSKIVIRNGHSTTNLSPEDYELEHYDERTVFINENDIVDATIHDATRVLHYTE